MDKDSKSSNLGVSFKLSPQLFGHGDFEFVEFDFGKGLGPTWPQKVYLSFRTLSRFGNLTQPTLKKLNQLGMTSKP